MTITATPEEIAAFVLELQKRQSVIEFSKEGLTIKPAHEESTDPGFKLPTLLEMRLRSGLTQGQVARALNIDQSAISLWESGKTAPRANKLVQLAKLYQCSVDDLLKDENEE